MVELTAEDIRIGFQALNQALGPIKARQLLDHVADGALDPSLLSRGQAFLRRNPELVIAGGAAIGTLLAGLLASGRKPRPEQSLRKLKALGSALETMVSGDVGQHPTEIQRVDVIDLTGERGSGTPVSGDREGGPSE